MISDSNDHNSNDRNDAEFGVDTAGAGDSVRSRRRILQLGAIGASSLILVKPALAQTAGSVLNCEIPIPAPSASGQYIGADGSLVSPDTPGSFAPPYRNFTGEEVKRALRGRNLPGASYEETRAYVNYIRRLQAGQSGFTCYASLQMPR
jgi:hypothetical protein